MLYLRHDLIKGDSSTKPEKAKKEGGASSKTGEQRGGKYVARVQTGYEKDGSPRYKYFDTLEERDKYLQSRGTSGDGKKRLKDKLTDEQKEAKQKQKVSHGKVESGKLFVAKDKKEKKESEEDTKKSISVFIWRLEE